MMISTRRLPRRVPSWLAISLLILVARGAGAQEPPTQPPVPAEPDDLTLVLTGDQRPRERLAFPAFEHQGAFSPLARDAARVIEETLRADLGMTGVFDVQGPEILSILELTGERARDFELYRSLNNNVILLGKIRDIGNDRVALEGRLYELESGQQILGKLYRGQLDVARRIAHTFSDEIVLYFTGRRGIALTTIAFVSDRDDGRSKELYLMDYDGYGQRRISGHRSISLSPAWSPDGSQLAYVSYFSGPPGIFRVDMETGSKEPIVADDKHNMSPAYSPDGRWIAFSRSISGSTDIYVVSQAGGDMRRLTNSRAIDTNPAWSPSGREIAFTSSRSGTPQLYVMDAEGTNPRRITWSGSYNDGASWHPEGTAIVYSYRERGGSRFDIAVVDVVTGESRLLTQPPGSHEAPAFSPDGRRIVFQSNRSGSPEIWVMSATGHDLRQLTTEGQNFAPAWSNYPK